MHSIENSIENRTKYNERQQDYFIKLFTKAMNEKKYVVINNNFIINVDSVDVKQSGCNGCKINYNSIYLCGIIYTKEDNYKVAHKYNTNISSYYIMCECDEFIIDDIPELLFKCIIDRDYDYIYDYFINKGGVQIIDDADQQINILQNA